jgi:glycosyltransferase involved in cell wall biosynthesis
MSAPPEVTVVIPSANRWAFVQRAVCCALGQVDVGVRVVVASDGPRHPTPPDVPELADDRVTVLVDPVPRGVCRARNVGIGLADTPWVAFLDDDDVWAPDKLRRQLDAAAADGAGFAYTSGVKLDADLAPLAVEHAPDPATLAEHALRMNPLPAAASNVVARRELVAEVGGFDERLAHFGDWDFALGLIAAAPGTRCPEPLVGYVAHDDAMHVRQIHRVEEELPHFVGKHATAGRRIHLQVSDRWIASGLRQAGDRRRASRVYLRSAVRHRSASDVVRAGAVLLGERAMRGQGGGSPVGPDGQLGWLERVRDRSAAAGP